jgi:hypothetical protein
MTSDPREDAHPVESRGRARPDLVTRRELMRWAGALGVAGLGAGLTGCSDRPEEDILDTTTQPTVLQAGGVVSGVVTGLLTGAAIAGATVRFFGHGQVPTDDDGRFEVRIGTGGDINVRVDADEHHPRLTAMRLRGNADISISMVEQNAGVSLEFLNQFLRGTGPQKEDVQPRTPGASNRWTRPPTVVIHRVLADNPRGIVPEARVDAMTNSIQALFGPLTGFRLGVSPVIRVVREAPPTRLSRLEAGNIAIGQRADGLRSMEHIGSLASPFEIVKAIAHCGVDATIEVFNHMFAHALGAYEVARTAESVMNPEGAAVLSARDRLAATVLYSRPAGSRSADVDPNGFFINQS